VRDIPGPPLDWTAIGRVDAAAGRIAHDCIVAAAQTALSGEVAGMVTAPINKASLSAAGCSQIGHTELLAEVTGVTDEAMLLYMPPGATIPHHEVGLGVVHTTLHIALRDVFGHLSVERIVSRCRAISDFVDRLLRARQRHRAPRVAVAALNPHGGEQGLFGREELEIIGPAVRESQGLGLPVTGPWPVDTLMARAVGGEFDAVVAMYHDQGHIALKLLGMREAVNVTLGLPIVRVSGAHGTAFEIAWQGRADCGSMIQSICLAAQLVRSLNH
ncbi:MAG TPA: 4-hydroxythreonine-4-phosphate dehydrogenase PdxA, partial [Pirellulaceae bacterium]|nr:4-hydroxythreonine-4-phosphate dehydrogenase PdxA [Pirellulaceae bacterium]